MAKILVAHTNFFIVHITIIMFGLLDGIIYLIGSIITLITLGHSYWGHNLISKWLEHQLLQSFRDDWYGKLLRTYMKRGQLI